MGIRVTCPSCSVSLRVGEKAAGRRGQCPKCGAVFTVPALATGDTPAPPPPPEPRATHSEPPPPPPQLAPAATSEQQDVVEIDFSQPLSTLPASIARATPVVVAPDAVDIPADEPLAPRDTSRRRAGNHVALPLWAIGAATAVLLVVGAAGALFIVGMHSADDGAPAVADRAANPAAKAGSIKSLDPRVGDGPAASAEAPSPHKLTDFNTAPLNPPEPPRLEPQKPPAGAPLEDVVEYVKHGIVKIETSDRWNNRRGLGSGFVIDKRGLIATTYHVVSDAVKADVVFSDGTRFGIEGYMAIDPHADLAILRLNGVPKTVQALELNFGDGPRDASQVYAIGHPHDNEFTTTGGIVGRVLHTSQLPDDTRQWLNETLSDSDDDLWIQHDARISPGNSGGPLINARGEVVGVNSWVNQKLGLGYAIHAKHLHELMGHQFTELMPLRDRRTPEAAQPQFAGLDLTSDRIRQLRKELTSKSWRPRNDRDCATFDELALTITAVKYIQSHIGLEIPMPRDEQQAVVREAEEAVAAIRAVPWKELDQMRPINAHGGLDRHPYGGAFVFATVKRMYQGDERENGLLIGLIGSREQFFVPIDGKPPAVREGDKVLVLGITHPASVRVGGGPRNAQEAQVLLSKVVLPLGK